MTGRKLVELVAAVAALAAVASMVGACSSTSNTTSGSPTTSTAAPAVAEAKAAFLTAANGICKTTNAKTSAIVATLPTQPTGAQRAAVLDRSVDIIQSGIAQMRKLEQPSGDTTQLALFYQRSQKLIVLTHQLADALRADKPALVTSIETEANNLDNDLTHAADNSGLTACGSGSGG